MSGALDARRTRLVLVVVSAAIFIETLQFSILSPVLPQLAEQYGLDDVQAGAISSAYAVGLVLLAIPAGRLAARMDERVGIGLSLLAIGVANVWFALANDPVQLGAARFVSGAASALVWAGGMAWVSSSGPRTTQATRLAAVLAVAIVGSLAGPALGTVVTVVGVDPVFLTVAVVSCVLVVPVWMLGESHATDELSQRGLRRLMRTAWLALAITFYVGFLYSALSVMVPLEAVSLGASATVVGVAFIVGSLGQALLGPVVGRLTDRRGAVRVMSAALSMLAVMVLGLVVAPGALGPVVVMAVLFPVGALIYAPSSVEVDHAAHTMRLAAAIALSAWNLVWALGVAVGAVAGPWVAERTGNGFVYLLLAVFSGLLAVAGWRAARGRVGSVAGGTGQ